MSAIVSYLTGAGSLDDILATGGACEPHSIGPLCVELRSHGLHREADDIGVLKDAIPLSLRGCRVLPVRKDGGVRLAMLRGDAGFEIAAIVHRGAGESTHKLFPGHPDLLRLNKHIDRKRRQQRSDRRRARSSA